MASTRPKTPPMAVALLPKASMQGLSDCAQLGQFRQKRTPKRWRSANSTNVWNPSAQASGSLASNAFLSS